jgi:molecular chaperone GrpE
VSEYKVLDEEIRQEDSEKDMAADKNEDAAKPAEDNEEASNDIKLQVELNEAKTKADEYYNHLQRLKAEFDNFRKRTVKEKEEAAKYASERIVCSLLPILDNFERALESAKNNRDFDSFSQGVEMIFRQLFKVLEGEGLKAIEAAGEQFDPNLHDALLTEVSDQAENIILEELQKGYYLKDKVIRPSRVKVSG